MCYMSQATSRKTRQTRPAESRPSSEARPGARPRVGVRELRQNLSVYVERVVAGERFEVTDRGNVVAMLIPVPPAATLVERLVAEGRAIPATRDHRSLEPLPPLELSAAKRRRIWAAFEAAREDRV